MITPREEEKHEALLRVAQGRAVSLSRPKNAFKYPEADDAVFPQHEVMKPIDFRASRLPIAGFAFRGNRRKYTPEEAEYIKQIAKTAHPKMEVLAGGGAILAKTGERVSKQEAELMATRINRPHAAALLEAGPPSAASAIASAAAEDNAAAMQTLEAGSQPVATSSVPVIKGNPKHKPKKKKGKGKVAPRAKAAAKPGQAPESMDTSA